MRPTHWTGLLLLLLLLSACKSEQGKMEVEIEKLEQKVHQNAAPKEAKELIALYNNFAVTYPEAVEANSKYLYRAAGLAYRMNRYSEAIELLNRALKDAYAGSNTANNALFLAAIYGEKMRNEMLAKTVYQAGAQAFPESEEFAEKLNPDWEPLEQQLNDLAQGIFDPSGSRIDYRIANDFINSATIYAMLLPEDEASDDWLFEAAETARSIRAYSKALDLYSWITEYFPRSDKAPQALFLQGFTLDSDLNRYEEAGNYYQAFLEKYPNDVFAKDARFLLDNLGKDEEEIIRSFEEKNQLEQ